MASGSVLGWVGTCVYVSAGVSAGIYTSESQWQPIFGSGYNGGASYPLWYAHYGTWFHITCSRGTTLT